MAVRQAPLTLTIASLTIAIALLGPVAPLRAQKSPINYNPPANGAPGGRSDAGSRGPTCPDAEKSFTIFSSLQNWGETRSERPTFWAYIPYPANQLELILKDEITKDIIGRATYSVSGTPGIVSLPVPQSFPALEPDRTYRWRFDLFCSDDANDFVTANGAIVRRNAPDASDLAARDRIAHYAQNGLWFDALTEAGDLRRTAPDDPDYLADWSALLAHPVIKLDDLILEPIVDCCESSDN